MMAHLRGFYPHMTMAEYHGDKQSYSKSALVKFAVTPAHCRAYLDRAEEEKKAVFDLGTAGHSIILEGIDDYLDQVAVIPESVLAKNGARSTNLYKEWCAAHPGKTHLLQSQVDQVLGMFAAVQKKDTFQRYLTGGRAEVSAFWPEAFDGHYITLKCRPDYLPGKKIVVDLKTTSLPIKQFPKQAERLLYHWSAWLTCRGLTELTGQEHREYLFAVVESNPPHDCQMIRTPEKLFRLAEVQLSPLLEQLADCDRAGVWPGSPDEIVDLVFSKFALGALPEIAYEEVA
jgi:hypothetical protein